MRPISSRKKLCFHFQYQNWHHNVKYKYSLFFLRVHQILARFWNFRGGKIRKNQLEADVMGPWAIDYFSIQNDQNLWATRFNVFIIGKNRNYLPGLKILTQLLLYVPTFLLGVIDTGTFAKDYVQSSTYLLDLTYMRVVLHCIQIQIQIQWPEIFLILETKTKRRTE